MALLSLISFSTLSSSATAAVFSASFAATTLWSFWMLAPFFLICHSKSCTSRSIACVWFLQSSTFLVSAASSVSSVAKRVSMAWITWSKCPTSPRRPPDAMEAASAAKRRLRPRPACACSSSRALLKGAALPREAASWRRVAKPGWMAFAKRSLAASLERMVSACEIPSSSSTRRAFLADQSSVLERQEAFVTSKKSTSAFNCASESA
mmetsp:Transcript_60732/g.162557  ORF Transcript_60732/g.162557 Transcript_60732/m.162557 type:complete len:208 (-) Transcript_60732:327-950(-)